MAKKKVNTSYIYEILKKDEVQQYLDSKDITDNEKSSFHSAVSQHTNLFKTTRMDKNIIVSKSVADDLIKEDSDMMKLRIVMYTLLLSLAIMLCGMIALDPVIYNRTFGVSDFILLSLTFAMTVCMGALVYDTLKDTKHLRMSKDLVDKENKSATEINIELRNVTL